MADYISLYQNYLTNVKRSSANTVDSYLRDVRGYIDFCDKYSIEPAVAAGDDISKYLKVLQKNGKTAATITRCLASIRSFYQFMIYSDMIDVNPTKDIKPQHAEKKLPEILTQKEVDRLLEQPDISTLRGCRDKAILELMYATGIRVTEMIELDIVDINLSVSIIHCRSQKADRVIPVYKEAIHTVEDYLTRVRPIITTDRKEKALFLNLNGERLTRQGFWKIIKGYAAAANIDKDITPHTIRHSFATHLLENGAGIRDVKEMLGHSGNSSTAVYTQIINRKYENSYNKFHPKAGAHR